MRRLVLALSLATLMHSTVAQANVPARFTVQGVLRDSTGALQSTTVTFVVKIWQSQTSMAGTDLLFTYSPAPPNNMVMAQNGLFTIAVTLAPSDVSAIGAALANSAVTSLWLEVTANGYVYTRQPLTEVMSAIFADGLSPNCSGCVADSMVSGVSASKLSGVVAVANGGTGSATQNFVDLSTAQTVNGQKTFGSPVGVGTAPVGALTVSDGSSFSPLNVATREVVVGEIGSANGFNVTGWCTGGLVGPAYCMGASQGTMYLGVHTGSGNIAQTMRVDSSGNVSIPSGSSYTMFSSQEYKKDIHFLDQLDLEKALKLILDTPVATFRNKAAPSSTKVAYGVIAERTPAPLLSQDNKAFSMSNAVGALMASVKAQQAHIAELEARLAKLEGRRPSSRHKVAPSIAPVPVE